VFYTNLEKARGAVMLLEDTHDFEFQIQKVIHELFEDCTPKLYIQTQSLPHSEHTTFPLSRTLV